MVSEQPPSRRLVVDACIVRTAGGEEATHADSIACIKFLEEVLDGAHRVVVTTRIEDEWHKHGSVFFYAWEVDMTSQDKLMRVTDPVDGDFRERLAEIASGPSTIDWIEDALRALRTTCDYEDDRWRKLDCHLVEAAMWGDRIVTSHDTAARNRFSDLAKVSEDIWSLMWLDPLDGTQAVVSWLREGAPEESHRMLGYTSEGT